MLGFKFFTPGSKSLFKLKANGKGSEAETDGPHQITKRYTAFTRHMTTSETFEGPSAGLLEQIATASLLNEKNNRFGNETTSDVEDDSDEEVFEDGDAGEQVEDSDNEAGYVDESQDGREQMPHESVAAVLTELSQATTTVSSNNNINNSSSSSSSSSNNNNNATFPIPSRPLPNPNMTATINSINALLQSHLHGHLNSSQPQKARLYGPIRANVNIRHGVWAPRLRCRKRKNLHAKDGIWINPTCTLEHLINLVKGVLPDEFEWDPQASPLRYQAVNDQSLQSLKTVSGTVSSGQSLFSAFDLVRNRRSDGDNFILQLYVYGTWTVLLKPHMSSSYQNGNGVNGGAGADDEIMNSITLPPPPKKKYQQAHYNQQMQMNMAGNEDLTGSVVTGQNSGMFHMRLTPPNVTSPTAIPQSAPFYTHPLSANTPVTYLPTVTLEMKMNGVFVPVEISRRSFVSAIRACSLPKPATAGVVVTNSNTAGADANSSNSSTPPPTQNNTNNTNITPPPSDS